MPRSSQYSGKKIRNARLFIMLFVRNFWRVCSHFGWVFAILFEVLLIEIQEEIIILLVGRGGVKGDKNCEQKYCQQSGVSLKRNPNPNFWSGYPPVGGSKTWRGGGQKFRYVPWNQGNQTFWTGYPGICQDIPELPERFENRAHAKGVVLSEKACFCLLCAFSTAPP